MNPFIFNSIRVVSAIAATEVPSTQGGQNSDTPLHSHDAEIILMFSIIIALLIIHFTMEIVKTHSTKNLKRELKSGKERYNNLFESQIFAFIKINFNTSEILSSNEQAANLFGYTSSKEFLGHKLDDYLVDKNLTEQLKLKLIDETKIKNSEQEMIRRDGSRFWGCVSFKYYAKDGTADGTITDITALKETETKLQDIIDKTDQANHAKSDFLASMSHEIRTPLSGVIGMLELAQDEENREKSKEFIMTALSSAKGLLGIVNNILDLSKIEAGKMDIEPYEFNLNELLLEVNSLAVSQINRKETKIDFKIVFETPVPTRINTDPTKLAQSIDNLVCNAIKFTEKGHVYLKISSDFKNGQNLVIFKVEDTGIGIPQERQSTILEPFTQADVCTYRKFGGTGLGLPLTKQMVSLLNGRLEYESTENTGSTFWITVPVGKIPEDTPKLKALVYDIHKEEKVLIDSPETLKILVAEDDPVNQQVISNILHNAGFKTTLVENGELVVNEAKRKGYDIILMDIQMPVKSGLEATAELRNSGFTLPIIALTASVLKTEIQSCYDMGCTDFLCKPFDHNELIKMIAKYTSHEFKISYLNKEGENMDSQDNYKILNWEDAMNRIGNEELFIEVTEKFFETSDLYIKDLQNCINNLDFFRLSQKAHQIKGAAATISAQSLSHAALELECASKDQNELDVKDKLCSVMEEFKKLKDLLSNPNWVETAKNS